MLHELLLSLSGHPSPLLSFDTPSDSSAAAIHDLTSPAELALLRSLAHLGALQSEIRTQCAALTQGASSKGLAGATIDANDRCVSGRSRATIAPAIAAAVRDGILARFQRHVRDVERGILSEDAALVGAYRVVPLACVASEFDGWSRVLEWVRGVLAFAEGKVGNATHVEPRAGAQILDHLRSEARTGYPDVEKVCRELLRVGEAAWVRQLAAWLLYGRLPDVGAEDFCIQKDPSGESSIEHDLLPSFVTPMAASSILFIGRSLKQVQEHLRQSSTQLDINSLRVDHLRQLSSLAIPIVPATLTRTLTAIRTSLARTTLQKLLPPSAIRNVLDVLRQFFLLERGEFAMALIGTVDAHLAARSSDNNGKRDPRRLGGALIKEAELAAIMHKTWNALAALQSAMESEDDADEDAALETAREAITLNIRSTSARTTKAELLVKGDNVFDDLLIGVPTTLAMTLSAPLDLFLTSEDLATYAHVHAFLLALRRAHVHLTGLNTVTVLRRTHPTPPRPSHGPRVTAARKRAELRAKKLRKIWATVAKCVYVLGELSAYFQGEVVEGAGVALEAWMQQSDGDDDSSRPEDPHNTPAAPSTSASDITSANKSSFTPDPATLRTAHQAYLRALSSSLLLNDLPFARLIRETCVHAERLVALVTRLGVVAGAIEAAELSRSGTDGEVVPQHLADEEDKLGDEINTADGQLGKCLRHLLERLREMDAEGLMAGMGASTAAGEEGGAGGAVEEGSENAFVPWKGPGLGQLLMRLEVGNLGASEGKEEFLERLMRA